MYFIQIQNKSFARITSIIGEKTIGEVKYLIEV